MEKLEKEFIKSGGTWKEYRIGDLFENIQQGARLKKDDHIPGLLPFVMSGVTDTGVAGYIGNINVRRFPAQSLTIDIFGNTFYRNYEFGASDDVGVYWNTTRTQNAKQLLYIAAAIQKSLQGRFDYGNKLRASQTFDFCILLPILNNKPAFSFMERYIEELEAERIEELEAERIEELEAYLEATGLKNYELNTDDVKTLDEFNEIAYITPPPPPKNNTTERGVTDKRYWAEFSLSYLFGESTRGKRLKSFDRIAGDLPFVTAGEQNTGISDFIGNDVEIFKANTTTIDMFGSAKYRNYCYGADDHVAVIHTEKLNKHAALFTTAAIHKAAHTDKFSYSNNFYASDADDLYIFLPAKNNEPDYAFMERFMQAVQKLVIKDVVVWTDKKMEAYIKVVFCEYKG